MRLSAGKIFLILVVVLLLVALGWGIKVRLPEANSETAGQQDGQQPAPVEVASVRRGPIELRRTFSGSLESPARFVVAPKVSGRIERLAVDIADEVERGQVVAELDDEEHVQTVAQAEAELAVARANLVEAENGLEIATRELERVRTLRERGVASESELDAAKADQLAKESAVEVTKARIQRAESEVEQARIRLGYTTVTADWAGGDDTRVVAERYVDEGDTVAANDRLVSIAELDPIKGVISVTEKDYGRLQRGQPVTLRTDAYPEETFTGRIDRVSPVFNRGSRQAEVELRVPNPEHRLKPGMFIRATVVLDRVDETTIVPTAALAVRGDETGVFLVSEDGASVRWRPVETGIRQGERIELLGEPIEGRVVTLGQQLLGDGSKIIIPDNGSETEAGVVPDGGSS